MKYMKSIFLIVFVFIVLKPDNAAAYLDPASGNALISSIIALVGTLLYMFKSFFYKLINRKPKLISSVTSLQKKYQTPVIFSEGKTYWTTFRPIVEEFIKAKVYFRYITLDVHDPALCIDSEFMQAKRMNKNQLGYAKIAKIKAPVMLSTTPNIGISGYPLKKPGGVKKLVHVFHAMADISCYRKGSLDHYDAVILTGEHEKKPIRAVEYARKIKKKELIVCGLPCLDDLYRQKLEFDGPTIEKDESQITVLVAPSWGQKGCFSEYGVGFIKNLSNAGFNVIIRLHPHSYIFEPNSIKKWRDMTADLANVNWDSQSFGTTAMSQADILISDTSSIRFDFTFLYNKPVVSLEIPKESRDEFESIYLKHTWADKVSNQIGSVVPKDKISNIADIVQDTLKEFSQKKLQKFRDNTVSNFGNSAPLIVKYISEQSEILSLSPAENKIRDELNVIKKELTDLQERVKHIEAYE